ncbi:hypothetical protein QR680_018630 [Steinernema hermaphroditum]|uniref:C-type lectin domain-containing protein n=1 Tax=Steinernema hermaphroditum TaxID=289476 RepID=A0AA39LQM7_9BILA|nr:hypothetical protein QR680_018630 [Steinernema hermaphroditum]
MKLLLLLSLFSLALATSPCPPGAILSFHKDKCFQPINLQTYFSNAERTCAMFGGSLASVTNQHDNYLLASKSAGWLWVGGAINKEAEWTWIDGQPMNYTNWAQNEPKKQPNYCVKIRGDEKWVTNGCEDWAYFACETNPVKELPKPCPEGYHCFKNYAYRQFIPSRSWTDAELFCRSLGGQLASIHSAEEQAFFESILTNTVWIGAHLPPNGKDPVWTDGSKLDFKKWRSGNPVVVEDDNCVFCAANYDPGWGNAECWSDFPFACKIPLSAF